MSGFPKGMGRGRAGELRLFDILMSHGLGNDVAITELYEKIAKTKKIVTDKRQQSYVGSLASRYNRKEMSMPPGMKQFYKIVPGELKRTYRVIRSI